MKSFWSYIEGENYNIGTTGGSVCVYDKSGNEIAVFKGFTNAYHVAFVPKRNAFIVRTAEATIAMFSLTTMRMIHKFRFSPVRAAQDYGFCFSKDGNLFYNIELFEPGNLNTRLAVYETGTFSLVKTFTGKQFNFLYHIETRNDDAYNLLGYDVEDQMLKNGYIAVFDGNTIITRKKIPTEVADKARWYKSLQIMGFTEKAKKWILPPDSSDYIPVTFSELLKDNK